MLCTGLFCAQIRIMKSDVQWLVGVVLIMSEFTDTYFKFSAE